MNSHEQGPHGQEQQSQAEHSAVSAGPVAADHAIGKTIASPRKIEANRRNALKSTGPRTPTGRSEFRGMPRVTGSSRSAMLDPKSLSQPDDAVEFAPKQPSLAQRVEANRRNARRSTGPKTPSKKNSSRNATKHNPPTSQGSLVASDSISNGASARTALRRSRTGKPGEAIKRDVADSISGLEKVFGTNDPNAFWILLQQVLFTLPNFDPNKLNDTALCVMPILCGLAPKDTLEGLLAAQMVGVHQLSMSFLARAVFQGQTSEGIDANVNRASKLLRTFMAQMEALDRHRGKIAHSMVVGNVNIADGGQAIVGPVNHPGPGKVPKDNEEKKVG